MMSVGDIVLRNDLQFERYRTPRPKVLQESLVPTPPGLRRPRSTSVPTTG